MSQPISFSNIISTKVKPPTTEDFPALNGRKETSRQDILLSNLLGQRQAVNSGNLEFSSLGSTTTAAQPLFREDRQQKPIQINNNASNADVLKDKYGMLGLVDVVRMTNPDVSLLSLGTDLTSLGLNLSGSESVYSNFMTPFSDAPAAGASGEPLFSLPFAYSSLRLPSPLAKMKAFNDETLFYIFYAMPRDMLQEADAQELY